MPASLSVDNVAQLQEVLQASLHTDSNVSQVEQKLHANAKKVLLHKIDFQAAEKPHELQLKNLKAKYIHLNPHVVSNSSGHSCKGDAGSTQPGSVMNGPHKTPSNDGLPVPKVIIYPEDRIRLCWNKVMKVGSGLHNLGNTCFLNATLQCLTYTPALVNFCLTDEHQASCKQAGFCMMCELQRHVRRSFEHSGNVIKPQCILQKLKLIARHMHWGRQEDAHEFLRYVVDALQRACLAGYPRLDEFSKETTVVNRIFGGFLRSQVQCLQCRERSNTYDPIMDICLDLKNVGNIEKALEKFVHPETLDNENAYLCPRCRQKVPAQKRFSIHKTPNVLTIQLKRFDCTRFFGKISKHIQFSERLNLRPYMSIRQGDPVMYNLYAVLVHSGSACNMGHYYCYVKSPSQVWYCMNDSMVQQVNAGRVLNAEAYLLFYIKQKINTSPSPSTNKMKAPVISPQPCAPVMSPQSRLLNPFSVNNKHNANRLVNGVHTDNELGMPVSRDPLFSKSSNILPKSETAIHYRSNTAQSKVSSIAPADKRDKISFGIKPPVPAAAGSSTTLSKHEAVNEKPRIVMHIKQGKVTTYETSPNGKAKIVDSELILSSATKDAKPAVLVPYQEDSDSDDTKYSDVNAKISSSKNLAVKKTDSKDYKEQSDDDKITRISSVPPKIDRDHSVIFDEKLNATTSVPGKHNLLSDKSNSKHDASASLGRKDSSTPNFKRMSSPPGLKSRDFGFKLGRSNSSPVKHSFSDPGMLYVTSPPSTLHLNSTTPWQVQYSESLASPSIGSTSSTGSVNSTTGEWKVNDKPASAAHVYPKIPDRQHAGWSVKENLNVTDNGHDPGKGCDSDKGGDGHDPDQCESGSSAEPSVTQTGNSNNMDSALDDSSLPLLTNNNSEVLQGDSKPVAAKCVTKIAPKRPWPSDNDSTDTNNSACTVSDSLSEKTVHIDSASVLYNTGAIDKSKVMNNKAKSDDTNDDDDDDDGHDVSTAADYCDTDKLLNGDSTGNDGELRHKTKKEKKHKKHKKQKQERGLYEELVNGSSSGQETRHKKHKKSKKHKHDYSRESVSMPTTPEDEGGTIRTQHRRSDSSDSGERQAKRRKKMVCDDTSSDSPPEYEWVERTKEAIEPVMCSKNTEVKNEPFEQNKPKAQQSVQETSKGLTKLKEHSDASDKPEVISKAPVHVWDEKVKDGFKKSATDDAGGSSTTSKSQSQNHAVWDGLKPVNVAKELLKQSARGYGDSVLSWDGGKSQLDTDLEQERHTTTHKRHNWSDEYDEDLDIGKVKKVKKQKSESSLFGCFNPFQRAQSVKNKPIDKPKMDWYKSSSSGPLHSSKSWSHPSSQHSHSSIDSHYSKMPWSQPAHHSYASKVYD